MFPIPWVLSCFLDTRVIVSLLLLLLGILIYARQRRDHVFLEPEGRAVLITGCDSGFGNQLARRLLDMGFMVFATCLFPDGEGAQSLKSYPTPDTPGTLKVIKLDVTSDKEVAEVKQYVQANLPSKGLWGLVNNAGVSRWGQSDWHTIAQYQKVVDINLLGGIRTTLAFAPLIRKSKGRMVFLSSINAYLSFLSGIYSMTKAGVERFCDSLRLEMIQHGVQVCIIEPGNYSPVTNIQAQISADAIWDTLSADAREASSKEYVEKITRRVNEKLASGSRNSYEVVDAIVDALTSATPKPRYLVASFAEKVSVYLSILLPTTLFDKILIYAMNKDK
ncbi:D-beta-hydroxybutyrate dehydrogenase, mitochondrial-like [Gastrophryne carolinensis]